MSASSVENATKTENTTLKTYGKLSLVIFLTLYQRLGLKGAKFCVYEAILPVIWIKPNAGVMNYSKCMLRVASRCVEQFEQSACGRMKSESNDNNDSFWGTAPSIHNNRGSSNLFHLPFLLWVLECFCFCSNDFIHKNYSDEQELLEKKIIRFEVLRHKQHFWRVAWTD